MKKVYQYNMNLFKDKIAVSHNEKENKGKTYKICDTVKM